MYNIRIRVSQNVLSNPLILLFEFHKYYTVTQHHQKLKRVFVEIPGLGIIEQQVWWLPLFFYSLKGRPGHVLVGKKEKNMNKDGDTVIFINSYEYLFMTCATAVGNSGA